jgi:DNA modification methylase
MKPYYEHGGISIYNADCLEVLPSLPPVDLILTDPPYNVSCRSGRANTTIGKVPRKHIHKRYCHCERATHSRLDAL